MNKKGGVQHKALRLFFMVQGKYESLDDFRYAYPGVAILVKSFGSSPPLRPADRRKS